jgi:hypothetical protein
MDLLRLLHIASVGFFSGSLFSMLMVQSLLQRSVDGPERLVLARTSSTLARVIVNPLAYAGFFSGLLFWYARFSQFGGARLMKCTPVYIHIMLLGGFLAVGFTQMWKARARKLAAALEKNAPADEVRGHIARGWVFALLALGCISTCYAVAVLHVPNKISPSCFADSFPH